MKHRQRLDRLKRRLFREPILLQMPDGSTAMLPGRSDYLLDLMMRRLNGEQLTEMDLIVESVSSDEPGGAHMVDMARLFHAAIKKHGQPVPGQLVGE